MTAPISPTSPSEDAASPAPFPKRVTRWEMPILLRIAMVFFTMAGAMFAFSAVVALPQLVFGYGTYSVNGVPVTKEEFFRTSGVIIFLAIPIFALYLSAMAFALIRERPWSRPLLMAYFPILGLAVMLVFGTDKGGDHRSEIRFVLIELAIGTLIAWWYLYRKRAVVAYYRALQGSWPAQKS